MKKLSSNELNVLSNVIREKINESKGKKISSKLEKDVDFKKLEVINKELRDLSKMSEKNNEFNELTSKLKVKYGKDEDIYFNNVKGKIKVNFNNYNNGVYNDLVLLSIGKEVDIESIVNKLVEKYSG